MFESSKSTRMLKKILKLSKRGKHEAVVKLADELYELYSDSEDQQKRIHAKIGLIAKTPSLLMLEKHHDAVLNSDRIISVFTDDAFIDDIENQYRVGYLREANWNKVKALFSLEEYDKAGVLIDSIVDEYITYTDDITEYLTANMLLIKADIVKVNSQDINDRLAVFNRIVNRYHRSNDFDVLDQVIAALTEMMIICIQLDDYKNALVIRQIAQQLVSADPVKVQRIVTGTEQFKTYLDEVNAEQ